MRLISSVVAGFIAFGAATPASLAGKPTSTRDCVDTVSAQPTPADGNWHIGCDENNYCSYYQDSDVAAANANSDSLSLRTITLSEATCQQCSTQNPCPACGAFEFHCRDCDHYQCTDPFLLQDSCFDVQPELADAIRNHTVTATVLETTTSTSVETTTSFTVVTVTAIPTSEASTFDVTTTITLARTAVPPRHTGLAPRKEVASNGADTQPPVRRTAAFKQSECRPCNDQTCPECHADCEECEKYLCDNLATHLSVCMSLRPKWQPPSFNMSASAPSETTTVVVMPQPGTQTITQTVVISTVIATIPTSSVSTVTILPVLPTPSPVVKVTMSAPDLGTTTVIVVPQDPKATSNIVSIPMSTVTVTSSRPQTSTVTVIAQPPQPPQPQTDTVTIHRSTVTVQGPASTVVVQNPASTVIVQQPASTIVLQPPTVTASPSPHVLEIPMTYITTATHTVARSARALQTHTSVSPSDSIIARPICEPCDGNPECDGCEFSCDEGCEHFLCKDPFSEAEMYISVAENVGASVERDVSMASGDYLGSAATLLVLAGDEDPTSSDSVTHLQPAVSNGTRPNFSFAEEDCYLCEIGDASCDMCDWQFTCGIKKRCFHNGAREVVEMCFEQGEKCRP